jgi:polar amino acid transport system substrate-binding protein
MRPGFLPVATREPEALNTPRRYPPLRTATLVAVLFSLTALTSAAQELPPFRWGTDPTGGAPFNYQDAAGNPMGFEVEIADYIAAKLGRQSVMVAGTWANLPAQLDKPADVEQGVDVVLNGYELRADLAKRYGVSRAYYAFRVTLLARKDDPSVRGWDDLTGTRVGVLGGTVAHSLLRDRYPGAAIESSEDVANVLQLVSDRRLPATVQDTPAATYYLEEFPDLHAVGEPVPAGYYVLYYRKDDIGLGRQLDAAIADGLRDGTFRRIYAKYNLWNADQAKVIALLDDPWPPADVVSDPADLWPRMLRELFHAAWLTVKLAFESFPLAMVLGLMVALGRVYGAWWLRVPLGVYVEVIRGTPLLLQLYAMYYMLPLAAERLVPGSVGYFTPFACGVLGLALNYSAYEAENYRAGLLAVPRGQMEAALALGMTPATAVRRVVVPQAVRVVIPPVTNDFIALFKDTSVCSVIMITELTRKYNELYNFHRDLIVELVFLTAGLYLCMSYPLALVAGRLERRYGNAAGGRA